MKLLKDKDGNISRIEISDNEIMKMSDKKLVDLCNQYIQFIPVDKLDLIIKRLKEATDFSDKKIQKFVKHYVMMLTFLLSNLENEECLQGPANFDADDISSLTIALNMMIRIKNQHDHYHLGEDEPILVYRLQAAIEELCGEKIIDLV